MRILRRSQLTNLRTVWRRESDFSDWLASEDGIEFIAEELGIEIEDPKRESRPGTFPCDIVGNLVGDSDHAVVIENQFNKTDHDHLGKMLTYAAVHKAMTAIWIAEHVAEDHRTVVDWLNENTPDSVAFFLAEIKAYQIGDSPVAPQLDVICRPNYAIKAARNNISDANRERHAWRIDFWTEISAAIAARNPPFNLQRPGPDHWSSIAIGRSGFHLNMLLTPRNQSIGIELNITVDGWKNEAFQALSVQREEIEREIGTKLDWRPMLDQRSARILLERAIDPSDKSQRAHVVSWFAENIIPFHTTFKHRVKALQQPPT